MIRAPTVLKTVSGDGMVMVGSWEESRSEELHIPSSHIHKYQQHRLEVFETMSD
jgi:hypothetical protein